jgi:hypothetical protein
LRPSAVIFNIQKASVLSRPNWAKSNSFILLTYVLSAANDGGFSGHGGLEIGRYFRPIYMKSVTSNETLDDEDGFILNIDVDPFDYVRNESGVSKQTDRDWRAITLVL